MKFSILLLFVSLCVPVAHAHAFSVQAPASSITVLVDLSESWYNPSSKTKNERILHSVADAILSATINVDPPITIRYLSIGDRSLARDPLCEVTFLPQIISGKQPDGYESSTKELSEFLGERCLQHVLGQRQEPFTDITGALDNVSRATKGQSGLYKAVIVLSDMKEERRKSQVGSLGKLTGARVLILYRALPEDMDNSVAFDQRIDDWRQRLNKSGAIVSTASDAYATAGEIGEFLSQ